MNILAAIGVWCLVCGGRRIFRDYSLRRGRLYPLLLLTVFFIPLTSYHLFFR